MHCVVLVVHVMSEGPINSQFFFLCYAVLSVPCGIVVTCREMADLLALLCVGFSYVLSLSQLVFQVRYGT